MNYRVFRGLVIGSIISLLVTLVLFFLVLFTGGLGSSKNRSLTLQLKQIVQQIADNQDKLISDSQQVGKLLNIPQEQYNRLGSPQEILPEFLRGTPQKLPAPDKITETALEKKGDSLEIAFYDALRYLERNLSQEQIWDQLNLMLDSASWQNILAAAELRAERAEKKIFLFPSDEGLLPPGQVAPQWFALSAKPSETVLLELDSLLGSYTGTLTINEELSLFVAEQSEQLYSLARQYAAMYRFITGPAVTAQLAAQQLHLKNMQPAKLEKTTGTGEQRVLSLAQTDWEVRTADGQVVASFYFDIDNYRLLWHEKIYQSQQLLQSDWDIFIANVDTRTEGQRREQQMRQYLEKMLSDAAFLLQMEQYGLRPAALPPRTDTYYEYYDLLAGGGQGDDGQRVASFALQKRIGEAYLMDRDDVKIRALKSFVTGAYDLQNLFDDIPAASAAKNSSYSTSSGAWQNLPSLKLAPQASQDLEVILLIGSHNNMADVIMLILIDRERQSIEMISLPRDLYYKQKKINAFYSLYGPQTFMAVLSDIAGLPISKYVSMDMYAFVEMVDLIGGIDVYLPETLIDPSYKIKQMGRWETLVMRRGQHHLDGLGALRYARSRHTSSDFERSERQQLILQQVLEKLSAQLSNPSKLLLFVQVLQKYLNTNFSSTEIARRWLKYRSYKRSFGNTINTDNVLYYTYSNYLDLSPSQLAAAQSEENFRRGSFILLPKGDDWNLIRRYIGRRRRD